MGYFQPLKWYQGKVLDWASRSGATEISKTATIEEVRQQIFRSSTVLMGGDGLDYIRSDLRWLSIALRFWKVLILYKR